MATIPSLVDLANQIKALQEQIDQLKDQLTSAETKFNIAADKLVPTNLVESIITELEQNKDLKNKFLLTSNIVADPFKYIFPPKQITAIPSISTISVTWDDVANAESYMITAKTQDGDPKILKTSNTGGTLSGLTPGTEYEITVTSANKKITSSPSKSIFVTTLNNA